MSIQTQSTITSETPMTDPVSSDSPIRFQQVDPSKAEQIMASAEFLDFFRQSTTVIERALIQDPFDILTDYAKDQVRFLLIIFSDFITEIHPMLLLISCP